MLYCADVTYGSQKLRRAWRAPDMHDGALAAYTEADQLWSARRANSKSPINSTRMVTSYVVRWASKLARSY